MPRYNAPFEIHVHGQVALRAFYDAEFDDEDEESDAESRHLH